MILTKTKSNLVEKKKHPGKKFSKWNFFIFIVIMIPIIIITFIIPIDNVVDALPTRTTTTKISRLSPSSSIPISSFSSEKAQLFEKRNDKEYRVKKSKRSKDKKIRTIINKEEYVKNKRREEITIAEDLSTTVAPPPSSSDEDQGDYDNVYNGRSRPVLLYWILAIVFVIILIEIMYWTYRLVYRLRYIANNNRGGVNNNNNNNRNQNVSTNVTSNNNRVLGDYVVNGSSVEEELPPYDGLSLPKYTEIVKPITDDNNVTDNNNSSETNNSDR